MEHIIQHQDIENISSCGFIPWDKLRSKTVLITGGTGLIGSNLIKALLFANKQKDLSLRIIAVVRSTSKAERIFGSDVNDPALCLLQGDVKALPEINEDVHYIIHGASVTDSKSFVEHPTEIISTAVDGTRSLLELAKAKKSESFVYLSSMEVYGFPKKGTLVSEADAAGFDTMVSRNCYPISKQICEAVCAGYAAEFGVPAMCVRLTQTFGPGVEYGDKRVFAEFMRCAAEGRDIVLKTAGETERCYLYTADSVTAILTVLLCGTPKECYNAANPDTYCSILEMAQLVAEKVADNKIKVRVELDDVTKYGYANTLYMLLDVSKLKALGWKPETSLETMYKRMLGDIIEK